MHSSRMRTAHSSSHRGVCLSACWDTTLPGVGLETLPGVGMETPLDVGMETPMPDPSTSPLCVGLETPPGQTPQLPPRVWAWKPARHAGIPPPQTCCRACWDTTCNACWDTTPPVNRITDMCKNITLPQLRRGR